jgi:hypothetical protein
MKKKEERKTVLLVGYVSKRRVPKFGVAVISPPPPSQNLKKIVEIMI